MIALKEKYEEYYLNIYGFKWDGVILEPNYLRDFKDSLKQLFDIEREVNPEINKSTKMEE